MCDALYGALRSALSPDMGAAGSSTSVQLLSHSTPSRSQLTAGGGVDPQIRDMVLSRFAQIRSKFGNVSSPSFSSFSLGGKDEEEGREEAECDEKDKMACSWDGAAASAAATMMML